jgi:crotonobetainyl-CoA:carnitine CoA-transferase CaiB-like acyl-CoA transferase
MNAPLEGVRVVEVASHVFVPLAGSVLAEWGAEVIKEPSSDRRRLFSCC